MTIYTIIFAFFAACGVFVQRQYENLVLGISLLFLLFFMGTRYEVGCDYKGYLNRYENTSVYSSIFDAIGSPEPAFRFLEIFTKTTGLPFVWLTFISTALAVTCYWVFLKNTAKPMLILALLFPIMMTQLGMSGIRQAIAVGLLLVAATSFMNGRRITTALWIALGAQFHISVAVFLPIALLAGREISLRQIVAAALLLSPIALLLVGDRIDTYQDRYIDEIYGDQSSAGASYRYILNFVPAALFIYFRKTVRSKFPREYQILFIFAIATLALSPLIVLSTFALHRLNFYVMPFTIMMAVYMIYCIPTYRERMLTLLIPIGAYGGYSVLWQMSSYHYQVCYANYQSFLTL